MGDGDALSVASVPAKGCPARQQEPGPEPEVGSMSEYVHHYLRAISHKNENISTSKGGTSHFSMEMESGRRPKLKSVEKCEVPPLYVEILRCENSTFPIHTAIIRSLTHLPRQELS